MEEVSHSVTTTLAPSLANRMAALRPIPCEGIGKISVSPDRVFHSVVTAVVHIPEQLLKGWIAKVSLYAQPLDDDQRQWCHMFPN